MMTITKPFACRYMRKQAIMIILSAFFASMSSANEVPLDGFPANGIVMRDETNVQIEKEDLYIQSNKIEVTYLFHNYSDKDIVTEVGFPIPPHQYQPSGLHYPIHADFNVKVNEKELKYQQISRAVINGQDYTDRLNKLDISITDFDLRNRQRRVYNKYFYTLSDTKRKQYIDLDIVKIDEDVPQEPDKPYYVPAWSVETTYFWQQIFPARSSIRIKISYTPNPSGTSNPEEDKVFINRDRAADPRNKDISEILCLNDELKKWERQRTSQLYTRIIDYILTTANHWKKPIKEFHLIIEADTRPDSNARVSTCFARQRLKKINDKRYELTIRDFEPKKEISVFFMSYLKPN